jgi:predicted metal-dependent phosphoesterase TrpH
MERRWNKADIHIHTNHSDGMAGVRAVLQHVAETDLRVIAITDHDTLVGAYEAREIMAERRYPFELVLGEEVSTSAGHVLALFIDQPITPGMSVEATIAAIHACGGLAIAAHPYGKFVNSVGRKLERYARGPEPHWRFDGVEAFNASLWNAHDNAAAAAAAASLGLPACGGSDSHSLATIGLGYTLFPGRTAADLRAAIVAGLVRPGGTRWDWTDMRTVAGEFIKRDFYRVLGRSAY